MLTLDLNKESGIALDLVKESPGLKNVRVLLNWDEHPVHAASNTEGFDLDLWAFALDANGKVTSGEQICYFNNKNVYNGAIVLPRDNRTGSGSDDEEILVSLDKIPSNIETVAIYAFVFDAAKRQQHFGMIANARVDVINNDTSDVIARYNITQDYNGQVAICVGNIERTTFTPDGSAGNLDPNAVLAHYS